MNDIRLAKLNIRLGREEGLEAALRALKEGNVDMGVLHDKNLTDGIHARQVEGYTVCLTAAEIRYQVGLLLVWSEDAG